MAKQLLRARKTKTQGRVGCTNSKDGTKNQMKLRREKCICSKKTSIPNPEPHPSQDKQFLII